MKTSAFLVVLILSYSSLTSNGVFGSLPNVVMANSGQLDVKLSCPIIPETKEKLFTSVIWLPPHNSTIIIGGGGEYDHRKYRYLASTGQLLFKEEVTSQDDGMYRCVVRTGVQIVSAGVQLIVKITYANRLEQELRENLTRAGVAVGLALATLLSICLIFSCRHKDKAPPRTLGQRSGHYSVSIPPPSNSVGISDSSVMKTPSGSLSKITPPPPGRAFPITPADLLGPSSPLHNNHSPRKLSNTSLTHSDKVGSLTNVPPTLNKASLVPSESISLVSIGINTTTENYAPKPGPTIIYITASHE